MKEELSGRTAGAVTLAVGMAKVFADLPGLGGGTAGNVGQSASPARLPHDDYGLSVSLRHHVRGAVHPDASGDRHARGAVHPPGRVAARSAAEPRESHQASWAMNMIASVVVCGLWGYLLYNFEIGRLWLMNGIGNQLLAVIGLAIGTTYLLQHSPKRVVRPLHGHSLRRWP